MRIGRYILTAAFAATQLAAGDTRAGAWIDVPFVRQAPEGCGAAAISMLTEYWKQQGAPVPQAPEQTLRMLQDPGGVPAKEMVAYLKQNGFEAFAFQGTFGDLEKHIALGRPLIVALDGGAGRLHYAVVAGVSGATVALNDPADRKLRQYSRADFEQKWSASERWTLLAVPAAGR